MKHVHQAARTETRTMEVCECGARRADGGEWRQLDLSAYAQAISRKYLEKATPEQLHERSLKAAQKRWKGKPLRERLAYMRQIAQAPRPSRVIKDRCPCGKYSKYTAKQRNHKCTSNTKN